PAVDIRNATNDHQIRRGNAVLEILVADLPLHLAEGRLAGRGSLGRNSSARVEVMSQFLDGHIGTKDPTFRVERCLSPWLEGGWVFHLDCDVVAFLQRNGSRLFQDGVHTNDYRLRRLRDAHKGDCAKLAYRARKDDAGLFGESSLVVLSFEEPGGDGTSKTVERMPARKLSEEVMYASLSPRHGTNALQGI